MVDGNRGRDEQDQLGGIPAGPGATPPDPREIQAMTESRTVSRGSRTWLVAVTALVFTALMATACTSTTGTDADTASTDDAATSDTVVDEGPPVEGGKLVFGINNESAGWNPHVNQWAQHSSIVGSSMLEPLAALDGNLDPVPWLATAWTPNETFDSWTIELRDDVTFHDGTAFDAAAVKANIDDIKSAALTGIIWSRVFGETTVVDDHTVRMDLLVPYAAFPTSFLASQTALMMAPSALTSEDKGIHEPIGTGPFKMRAWKQGDSLTVVKNKDYWQEGLPHLDEMEFKVLADASAMASAMLADDIDIAFTPAMATVTQVPDTFTIIKDWDSEPGMAIVNTVSDIAGVPNPMANQHARKALAYATDQDALAALIGEGVQTPSSPFTPDRKWGMPEDQNGYVSFDLDQAKKEVAEYQSESGIPLVITLSSSGGTDTEGVVQVLQNQWEAAGVDVTIETKEATAFINDVVVGNYQVALFNIYGAPDPDQNYHFWTEENANGPGELSINFTQFTSPTMQENLEIGRANEDFATRKAAYDTIVKEINAAAVNIWTYSIPYSLVATERVHGLAKPAEVPFGNYQPKTWLGDLWLAD
jgi:peptide/nickel transport system substrate-binding protein